ncbi:hypothetical protein [Xanthomonas sp. D-109]|nr:hypothetical protein [Xanthomonas sp. D-109]
MPAVAQRATAALQHMACPHRIGFAGDAGTTLVGIDASPNRDART